MDVASSYRLHKMSFLLQSTRRAVTGSSSIKYVSLYLKPPQSSIQSQLRTLFPDSKCIHSLPSSHTFITSWH